MECQLETEHNKTPFIAGLFNLSSLSGILESVAVAAAEAEDPRGMNCQAESSGEEYQNGGRADTNPPYHPTADNCIAANIGHRSDSAAE
ncbi:hypothetical protein LINGRAHAP2_LOCUS19832 [Linum grandiflorum]